jgi:hypothetical protein
MISGSNFRKREKYRAISLDALLILLVLTVPLIIFLSVGNEYLGFVNLTTAYITMLMSLCLCAVIFIFRQNSIPLLKIFLLVYILFWHVRLLTLTVYPSGELVLTRTVIITPEMFNEYLIAVFLSLASTTLGIILGHFVFCNSINNSQKILTKNHEDLKQTIQANIRFISTYCVLSFLYQIASSAMTGEAPILWMGYLSFFFPLSLLIFLLLISLIVGVDKKFESFLKVYLITYVIYSVLLGSRSFFIFFSLGLIFLLHIFGKKIKFSLAHITVAIFIAIFGFTSFAYGTYQRHMRDQIGVTFNIDSIEYVAAQLSSIDSVKALEPILATAFARAGYLDYSAEMFSNPSYGLVVTFENVVKSIIDGYIPGAVFSDSKQIALRIIDVYSPNSFSYQSDALGAVGENYLLFGYVFPLVLTMVAFLFSGLYYLSGNGIWGMFIKFSTAFWMMTWWNSFGYDWLFFDIGRQLIFGYFVLMLIFRKSRPIKLLRDRSF